MMNQVVPLEAAVVRRIMRLLKKRGAWFIKTTGVSKVGCPDIIACYNGRFLAIECKSAVGTTSRKQDYELYCIKDSGGVAIVASTVDQVERAMDAMDAET